MAEGFTLLFGAMFVIASWYFAKSLVRRRQAADLMDQLTRVAPSDIREVTEGRVTKVSGRLHYRGQPLTAPFSGRACAYYSVTAEKDEGEGSLGVDAEYGWTLLFKDENSQDFIVSDRTGSALVRAHAARFVTAPGEKVVYDASATDDRSAEWLRARSKTIPSRMRYSESLLVEGDEIIMIGEGCWKIEPRGEPTSLSTYREAPRQLVFEGPVTVVDAVVCDLFALRNKG